MIHFVCFHPEAYIRADHIQGICECMDTPRVTDTRACELIVPTFATRCVLTLSNGMHFYSNCSLQEIKDAVAQADSCSHNLPMRIAAISRYVSVKAAYIVAVLPYHRQLRNIFKKCGSSIHCNTQNPRCLILLDDGTCLLAGITPTKLMEKLHTQQA